MLNYSFWTSSLILEIKKTCHWSSFQARDQSSRDLKLSIWYKMSLWTVILKSLNTVSTINLFYHEQNSFLILRLVIRMRNRLMSFLWDQFYEVYPLNLELNKRQSLQRHIKFNKILKPLSHLGYKPLYGLVPYLHLCIDNS